MRFRIMLSLIAISRFSIVHVANARSLVHTETCMSNVSPHLVTAELALL